MTYFLPDDARRMFEQRAKSNEMSEPPRKGYFRLFNKNETFFVRMVGPDLNRFGWIVETDEPIPSYFKDVLNAT